MATVIALLVNPVSAARGDTQTQKAQEGAVGRDRAGMPVGLHLQP